MIAIKLSVLSKEKEIKEFLDELKSILQSEEFDIHKNLVLIKTKKIGDEERYSTPYTLLDLDYDPSDVAEQLMQLTIKEYAEKLMDVDDQTPPLLFVFGKEINGKQVYIKLKIKEKQTRYVLCVSFHYAKEKMEFPYA